MNSSTKVTMTPLPSIVTNLSSPPLTDESESYSTDFQEFLSEVIRRLALVKSHGQKNRLYKITLLVGNFDETELLLQADAHSMMSGLDRLQSTPQKTDGSASELVLQVETL